MPTNCARAPTGRYSIAGEGRSIPNVPFVDFDALFGANEAELVLVGHAAVVLLLAGDVAHDRGAFGLANGERTVAGLPVETL